MEAMMRRWEETVEKVRAAGGRTGVVLQGDTLDCWGLSSFSKSSKRNWQNGRLRQEVDAGMPFFRWLMTTLTGLPAVYILGNHEARIQKFLDDHHTLEGLPGVQFGALTGLDKVGFDIVDHGGRVLLGNKLLIAHGDVLTGWRSPQMVSRNYPDQVTVYGHTHHISSHLRTWYGPDDQPNVRGAYNIGHMSLRPEYYYDCDWQLGFAEIEFLEPKRQGGDPYFSVHQRICLPGPRGGVIVA